MTSIPIIEFILQCGIIQISESDGQWQVEGTAERIGENEALWSMLEESGTQKDLQPAHVQFALLPIIAREDGRRLGRAITDASVTLTF